MGSRIDNTVGCHGSLLTLTKRGPGGSDFLYQKMVFNECTRCSGTARTGPVSNICGTVKEGSAFDTDPDYPCRNKDYVLSSGCLFTFRLDRSGVAGQNNPFGQARGDWLVDIIIIRGIAYHGVPDRAYEDLVKCLNQPVMASHNPVVANSMEIHGAPFTNVPTCVVVHRERRIIKPEGFSMYLYGAGVYPGYPPQWLEYLPWATQAWEIFLPAPAPKVNYGADSMDPLATLDGQYHVFARLECSGHYTEGDYCRLTCTTAFNFQNK